MDAPQEADRAPGCRHPRETYALRGHEAAEREIAAALDSGKVHHAWLIAGPQGVGKATLAYRFARRILGAAPDPERGPLGAAPDDPACRRIEAQAHGGLLTLRRPSEDGGKTFKSVITVEEARRAPRFFSQSSGEGGWRVVIVDSADELQTPQTANALLKTLEEPPDRGLLILVSHAPGRLLPTIRSRCRRLTLRPLAPETAIAAAREQVEIDDAAADLLARLAEGAPGRAASLAAMDAPALHARMSEIFASLPRLDAGAAHALSDSLAPKAAQDRLALFHRLARRFAHERALGAIGVEARSAVFPAPPRETQADAWRRAWERLGRQRREQEALYLDPKLGVMTALTTLKDAAAA